jgi:hypothetical protein
MEERIGLKPVIEGLIGDGLLEPCTSPFNTPILPGKKTNGSHQLVQDLRAINQIVKTKYPYTILSKIPYNHEWFSVIDLKDAFWACPLDTNSWDIVTFEWEDPHSGLKQQYRWTVVPQGFTDSPHLFGQILEQVLEKFNLDPHMCFLQYVDDLLLSGDNQREVINTTINFINFLGSWGLCISKNKLQFAEAEVKYLGHLISKD